MQKLSNHLCTIEITEDPTYTVDSVDNRPYDRILNPRGYRRNDFTRTFVIRITLPERTYTIALIGEGYAVASDCAVLQDDELLVLQNRDLTRIRITDGQVLTHTYLDRFGMLNSIYLMPDGYLVVGELEVFRLDRDFQEKWSYGAHGVIMSWRMQEEHILLWEEETTYDMNAKINKVKLGFDGRVLSPVQPPCATPVQDTPRKQGFFHRLRQKLGGKGNQSHPTQH